MKTLAEEINDYLGHNDEPEAWEGLAEHVRAWLQAESAAAVPAPTSQLMGLGRISGLTEARNVATACAERAMAATKNIDPASSSKTMVYIHNMFSERYIGATHVAQDIQALIDAAGVSQTTPLKSAQFLSGSVPLDLGPWQAMRIGEDIQNAKKLRTFAIWSEGYAATGEHGEAMKHGEAEGEDFPAACRAYARQNPRFAEYFNSERLTYWGCRLFPTEDEARKSFG